RQHRQSGSDPPDRSASALHAWWRRGRKHQRGLESDPAPGAPVLPMIAKFVLGAVLAVVMFVCATTSYLYLGSKQSKVTAPAQKPTAATPRSKALPMPGSLDMTRSSA